MKDKETHQLTNFLVKKYIGAVYKEIENNEIPVEYFLETLLIHTLELIVKAIGPENIDEFKNLVMEIIDNLAKRER